MAVRVTMLGCGSSGGVPLATNDWGQCDPSEPRNRRRRPSILIETAGKRIVVDTGPDFREQMLAVGGGGIDAVIYTHGHADHIHGIDDIRSFNFLSGEPIDAYATRRTFEDIAQRFAYALRPRDPVRGFFRPHLTPNEVEGEFSIGDAAFRSFPQQHGRIESLGLRIDDFAYSTDVVDLDEAAFAVLEGVDTWIVDCFGMEPHPAHAHLDLALEWIEKVAPRRAILTHMSQTLGYERLIDRLPPGVEPGFDGMVLDC